MPELVNTRLICNPLNWAIVLLMLMIVSFAVDAIIRHETAGK